MAAVAWTCGQGSGERRWGGEHTQETDAVPGGMKANWAEWGDAVGTAARGLAPRGHCCPPQGGCTLLWTLLRPLQVGPARVTVTKLLEDEPAHDAPAVRKLPNSPGILWCPPNPILGSSWGSTARQDQFPHGCPHQLPGTLGRGSASGNPQTRNRNVKKSRSQAKSPPPAAQVTVCAQPSPTGHTVTVAVPGMGRGFWHRC